MSLQHIYRWEGGWTESPNEPGGASNLGISMVTFADWRKANKLPPPTFDDLRNITKEEAGQIYAIRFAIPIRFNELPLGVDYRMLDIAVNLGAAGAIHLLQKIFGAVEDGLFLSNSLLAAVIAQPATQIIQELSDGWIAIKKTQSWTKYGRGWTNRNNDVTAIALAMVNPPITNNHVAHLTWGDEGPIND